MFNQNTNPTSMPFNMPTEDGRPVALFASDSVAADWSPEHEEGQLSIDVLETEDALVLVAPMAGTKPENIELHLHNDFLTIRGVRQNPGAIGNYFYQECYWGKFSRTVVLPVDVKSELAQAEYKNGVLTIRLPKAKNRTAIPIMVVE